MTNKYKIGDVILTKTNNQMIKYIEKNVGHLTVIFNIGVDVMDNRVDYNRDIIINFIRELKTRKFVVLNTYKVNDLTFVELYINTEYTLTISTEMISKVIDSNKDIKVFNTLFNKLKKCGKSLIFKDVTTHQTYDIMIRKCYPNYTLTDNRFVGKLMCIINENCIMSLDISNISGLINTGTLRVENYLVKLKNNENEL